MNAQKPEPKPCPLCTRDSLLPHCPEARCGWWSCINRRCDAVLDFRAKRGHCIDATERMKRRKVEFLPGGEVA